MDYSQRTMLPSLHVVLSEQSYDSSTGREERASVERPVAAGHLRHAVGPSNEI